MNKQQLYTVILLSLTTPLIFTGCPEPEDVTYRCAPENEDDCPGTLTCHGSKFICVPRSDTCGDSYTQPYEECDNGPTPSLTCPYGEPSCMVCNAECKLVAGTASTCGDGILDTSSGEACDEGPAPNQQCAYGEESCLVCSSECTFIPGEATNFCGNGTTDSDLGEECDEGENPSLNCAYGDESCTVCNSNCKRVAGITRFCGDNKVDEGEECDHGKDPKTTCDYGEESCTVCNSNCKEVPGEITGRCGDGILQEEFEDCDGGTELTCLEGAQMAYGTLACNNDCSFDSSQCYKVINVEAGHDHICALTNTNDVLCWGSQSSGATGQKETDNTRHIPYQLQLPGPAEQLIVAGNSTCVYVGNDESDNSTAGLYCLGDIINLKNENNNNDDRVYIPLHFPEITSGENVVIATQEAALCQVNQDQTLSCPINYPTADNRNVGYTPDSSMLTALGNIYATSSHEKINCVISDETFCSTGEQPAISCWQSPPTNMGPTTLCIDSSTISNQSPIQLEATSNLGCVLFEDNSLACWYEDETSGITDITGIPIQEGTFTERQLFWIDLSIQGHTIKPIEFALGSARICIVSDDGKLYCWGNENNGELGLGTQMQSITTPQEVKLLDGSEISNWVDVTISSSNACAVTSYGEVYCWGADITGITTRESTDAIPSTTNFPEPTQHWPTTLQ